VELIVAEILGPDMLIILAIVALLFGGRQLPKLARSLGSAKSEFEKGIREGDEAGPAPPAPDEAVTMTRAELDQLIAEREARGRGEAPSPSPS
jgi:sec-independent protein translocase protein TatA